VHEVEDRAREAAEGALRRGVRMQESGCEDERGRPLKKRVHDGVESTADLSISAQAVRPGTRGGGDDEIDDSERLCADDPGDAVHGVRRCDPYHEDRARSRCVQTAWVSADRLGVLELVLDGSDEAGGVDERVRRNPPRRVQHLAIGADKESL